MIKIIDQPIADYFRNKRIVGLSKIVDKEGSTFIMCHDSPSDIKPAWSIVFDAGPASFWAHKGKGYNEYVSRAEFIDFIMANYPQYFDWLLFNIADIDSGEIAKS